MMFSRPYKIVFNLMTNDSSGFFEDGIVVLSAFFRSWNSSVERNYFRYVRLKRLTMDLMLGLQEPPQPS